MKTSSYLSNFALVTVVTLQSLLLLSSCNNNSGGNKSAAPAVVPVTPATLPGTGTNTLAQNISFPFQYKFIDISTGCTTQITTINNLQQYCSLLVDENFNMNCAREKRSLERTLFCGTSAVNPNPVPNPAPVTPIENNQPPLPLPGNPNLGAGTLITCSMQSSAWNGRSRLDERKIISWTDKKLPKTVELSAYSWTYPKRLAKVSVRLEPARLGGLETLEIIAEHKEKEGVLTSVKGFAGRAVSLEFDDSANEKSLRINCEPQQKTSIANKAISGVVCVGKVTNTATSETMTEFNKTIPYADLSSSVDLLERRSSRLGEALVSGFGGDSATNEAIQVELNQLSRIMNSQGRGSFRSPIEMTFRDRVLSTRVDLKCNPLFQ